MSRILLPGQRILSKWTCKKCKTTARAAVFSGHGGSFRKQSCLTHGSRHPHVHSSCSDGRTEPAARERRLACGCGPVVAAGGRKGARGEAGQGEQLQQQHALIHHHTHSPQAVRSCLSTSCNARGRSYQGAGEKLRRNPAVQRPPFEPRPPVRSMRQSPACKKIPRSLDRYERER
jgi:hypothetical protein